MKPTKRKPPPSSPLPLILGIGGILVVAGGIAIALANQDKPTPAVLPPPTALDPFSAAWQRGLEAMNRARGAATTDFDAKRRGYDEAEKAFQEALAKAPTSQQAQEIRMMIVECHKSRPMGE